LYCSLQYCCRDGLIRQPVFGSWFLMLSVLSLVYSRLVVVQQVSLSFDFLCIVCNFGFISLIVYVLLYYFFLILTVSNGCILLLTCVLTWLAHDTTTIFFYSTISIVGYHIFILLLTCVGYSYVFHDLWRFLMFSCYVRFTMCRSCASF